MLLTLTMTAPDGNPAPATDLGFLLHKHPDKLHTLEVASGTAHVVYPTASVQECTAALLLEVDPVALVRGSGHGKHTAPDAFSLGQYVNDRPYAAGSLLAVALRRLFGTALTGRCDARPELAARPIPLAIRIPVLPCRGGPDVARRLFEPLGWDVAATPIPLDETVPAWGTSRYVDVTLTGTVRLADALSHLYVLLPVLDDAKHYWVGSDEVDKLVRRGGAWLAGHPERELISSRYLAHRSRLTRDALARLAEVDDTDPDVLDDAIATDAVPDKPPTLAEQRLDAVLTALREAGAATVADLGCGEGVLTAALLADRRFTHVTACDVSIRALQTAARRLRLDNAPEHLTKRLTLAQSSLVYRDERLRGLDAAVLMEVIEHVDPERLPALERAVFGEARPATVVVTTPNAEYNVRFPSLPAGSMRHRDHRFEWTRAEFEAWAAGVGAAHGYTSRFVPVGPFDDEVGAPTQLAVLTREGAAA
ncbi:MAG: 3' terminal RNA ribose 2'-O-methyltransferase Hen1 [Kineosporiaceae bacterium]